MELTLQRQCKLLLRKKEKLCQTTHRITLHIILQVLWKMMVVKKVTSTEMHPTAENKLVACLLFLWCPFNQFRIRLLFFSRDLAMCKNLSEMTEVQEYSKYCLYIACHSGIETSFNLSLSCFCPKDNPPREPHEKGRLKTEKSLYCLC